MPSPTVASDVEHSSYTDPIGREHTMETTYGTDSDGNRVPVFEKEHIQDNNSRFSSIDIEHTLGSHGAVIEEHVVRHADSGEYNDSTRYYNDHGELTSQRVVDRGPDGIPHTTETLYDTSRYGLPVTVSEKETYVDKEGYRHEIDRTFETTSFKNDISSENEVITDKDGHIVDKDRIPANNADTEAVPSDVSVPDAESVDTRETVVEHTSFTDDLGAGHGLDTTYAINADGSRDKISEVDRVDHPADGQYSSETVERRFDGSRTAVEVHTIREEFSGTVHDITEKYSITGSLTEDHRTVRNPDGSYEERFRTFEANAYDVPMTSYEKDISVDKNGYRVETNHNFETSDFHNREISSNEVITDRDGNIVDRDQMMAARMESETPADVSKDTPAEVDYRLVTIPDKYTDSLGREHSIERTYAVYPDDRHSLQSEKDNYDNPAGGSHVETERKYYDNGQSCEERITRTDNSGIVNEEIKHYSENGTILDEKISRVNTDGSRHDFERTFELNSYNLPKTNFERETITDTRGIQHIFESKIDPRSFNSKVLSTKEYYLDKDGRPCDKDGHLNDKANDVDAKDNSESIRNIEARWTDDNGHEHTVEISRDDDGRSIHIEHETWKDESDGVITEHETIREADGVSTSVEERSVERYDDGSAIETTTKYTESPDGGKTMLSESTLDITDKDHPVEIEEKHYENGKLVSVDNFDSDGNIDNTDRFDTEEDSVDASSDEDDADWDPVD